MAFEELSGFLQNFSTGPLVACIALAACVLGFWGAPLWAWTLATAAVMLGLAAPTWAWIVLGVPLVVMNIPVLRRSIVSATLMTVLKKLNILPAISDTERVALEAGTAWVDKELFSGAPNFNRILSERYPTLSPEEQAFLDGPVENVCRMTDDWSVYSSGDLPTEVWDYLKKERFLGLIVPKEYGGLGFSANANSAVIAKMSSRSVPLAITVMVPNSLGPAELLSHYGTQQQKDYYLPRLARGEELPCFALTEPEAGSDATSISSSGTVFKGEDGKLYVKLNWKKRYITLAAVSTVIGLAVRLRDPDNLLGKGDDLGITCFLVPRSTAGVVMNARHNPMGIPFFNCPTEGKDVIVSVDQIIGGVSGAGRGWSMLMECLAAGRAVSLPAQATGGAKLITRVASSYAMVREQFGMSIGKFEGIEEPLARIGGLTYLLEASRAYTCGSVDSGLKPSVVSAIAKYNSTEIGRKLINDGMDILGGAGISRGPRNLLANCYIGTPVGITVEGANILTRTLMIFGQGALRCHPWAYKELKALTAGDLKGFDEAFWGHVGLVVRNFFRSVCLSVTRGHLASSPVSGPAARYYKKIAWSSASFALIADIAMAAYGGNLKLKEKITGRFADILSFMYLGVAVLRRFEAEGQKKEDLPLLHWSMQYCLREIQAGFEGLFANIQLPLVSWVFRKPLAWWSRLNPIGPALSDDLGHKVVACITKPGAQRDRLTDGIFYPKDPNQQLTRLDNALELVVKSEEVFKKIRKAVKAKQLPGGKPKTLVDQAVLARVITAEEAQTLKMAMEARADAIQVDSFKLTDEMLRNAMGPRMTQVRLEAGV